MKDKRVAFVLIPAIVLTVGLFSIWSFGSTEAEPKKRIEKEKQTVLDILSRTETVARFGKISDTIWEYAELGLQEFRSAELLASTLEEAGFTVERGLAGMPTCFIGTYGSGKPVIGLLGEFDALPMLSQKAGVPVRTPVVAGAPGHGCGHNAMATAAVAAAVAVKEAMVKHGLSGTIKVYGSPAEEIVASRPYMVRAGLFEGVDAVIDNHSSDNLSTGYGRGGNALFSSIFTFTGKTAHGASAWEGRSALDAVELMNIATNYLREHLPLSHRLHYIVLEGGEAPNVVPDRASVWYYVRNTDERLENMYERVVDCAEAAALATGTELLPVRVISAIHQTHGNKGMAELIQKNIELVGLPAWSEEEVAFAKALQKELKAEETGMPIRPEPLKPPKDGGSGGGSSDVGEVTLIAPTATLAFPGRVPGAISHHWSTVACTSGTAMHKGLNAGAKVIAAAAVDLLTKPGELKKIRDEFEAYSAKNPYRPFLPADAAPPLDLNKTLMDKFRPLMDQAAEIQK